MDIDTPVVRDKGKGKLRATPQNGESDNLPW